MFSALSASPEPGFFLIRKHDLDFGDEDPCIDIDHNIDDKTSVTSSRPRNCPSVEYETEDTETSYQGDDDSDVSVWSLREHKRPRNQL